jgi:hypothetical protein
MSDDVDIKAMAKQIAKKVMGKWKGLKNTDFKAMHKDLTKRIDVLTAQVDN